MQIVRDMSASAKQEQLLVDSRKRRPPEPDQILPRGPARLCKLYHRSALCLALIMQASDGKEREEKEGSVWTLFAPAPAGEYRKREDDDEIKGEGNGRCAKASPWDAAVIMSGSGAVKSVELPSVKMNTRGGRRWGGAKGAINGELRLEGWV